MAVNALELIDQELTRAAAPRPTNKRPVFLFLKEGQKALIRPLYNLKDCLVLNKHNKWSDQADYRVNAICGAEIQQPCMYCEQVANDKKLSANVHFYLPVYVYSVIDQATGQQITFKEKVDDKEVEKPVRGIRVLELTSFGTIGQMLKWFRDFIKDSDNGSITARDFTISQVGSGQKKTFAVVNKDPRPMPTEMTKMIPSPFRLRERILEALPPQLSAEVIAEEHHNKTGESMIVPWEGSTISDVQHVQKRPQPVPAEVDFDDAIRDF